MLWYPASDAWRSSSLLKFYLVYRFASPSKLPSNPSSTKSEDPIIRDHLSTPTMTSTTCSLLLVSRGDPMGRLYTASPYLNCVSKWRITVSPAIVMACEGFSKSPNLVRSRTSRLPHTGSTLMHYGTLWTVWTSIGIFWLVVGGMFQRVEPLSDRSSSRPQGLVGYMNIWS